MSWMYIQHGKKNPFSSSTQHTGGGGVVTVAYDNSNKGAANVLETKTCKSASVRNNDPQSRIGRMRSLCIMGE
jgi:hypothetical protein